jgi:long-chain acyl-CoA synthetase
VELSHRALWANTLQLAAWDYKMEFARERILGALPLAHSYGFMTSLSLAIRTASTLILCESLEPEKIIGYCTRFHPSLLPGVPALYSDLLAYARLRKAKLHSIRACISGASPLPVEVQEGFEKVTKGRLVEGYGLTEASPVTHSNPLYGLRKPGSIGIPMPSTEARVIDLETGLEADPGKVGELVVRGPQLMSGYFGNPEASARALRDGWLHTGDIVQRDGDGYFFVISRRVDCLELDGQTVFPRDIEEIMYQHPAVREVAVVGWPAPDSFTDLGFAVARGLRAFVSLRPERRLSMEELQAFCSHHLPAGFVPKDWKFLKQLPRTPFGKVSRPKLYDVPHDEGPAGPPH